MASPYSDESGRLLPPHRHALNMLIDNEIYRSEVQLGRIDEYKAYKQLKKTLTDDPFYAELLEAITAKLLDRYCKEQVQHRIDHSYVSYEISQEQYERLPEDLKSKFDRSGRQRKFVRVDKGGGRFTPKRVTELDVHEHRRVGEQRQMKISQLANVRNWHYAVAEAGERLGIEERVAAELFAVQELKE